MQKVSNSNVLLLCLFIGGLLVCVGIIAKEDPRYFQCRQCPAVYKMTGGLNFKGPTTCRRCGVKSLRELPERLSGWDEERYQRNGDEIPH